MLHLALNCFILLFTPIRKRKRQICFDDILENTSRKRSYISKLIQVCCVEKGWLDVEDGHVAKNG